MYYITTFTYKVNSLIHVMKVFSCMPRSVLVHYVFSLDGRLCDVLGESRRLTRNQTEFARRMTPGRLLTFVTGCSREPAGGFTPRPSIVFNYSATWWLPSASTCSNQIQLTVHPNLLEFQSFCHTMMTSMMNGETFSTA